MHLQTVDSVWKQCKLKPRKKLQKSYKSFPFKDMYLVLWKIKWRRKSWNKDNNCDSSKWL